MPIYKSHGDTYRRYFEETYGASIRHDTWLKYKGEMRQAGLELIKENVQTYAKIKKLRPRSIITKSAIDKMRTFTKRYMQHKPSFRGCDVKDLIFSTIPGFKEDTFYKCFKSATNKGFKAITRYTYEETATVLAFCLVVDPTRYKPRKITKKNNQITVNIRGIAS